MTNDNPSGANGKTNKRIVGRVISDRMRNTIIVERQNLVKHPRYKKYVSRRTRVFADNPDNQASIDDVVVIEQCRPLSKLKHWKLIKVQSGQAATKIDI